MGPFISRSYLINTLLVSLRARRAWQSDSVGVILSPKDEESFMRSFANAQDDASRQIATAKKQPRNDTKNNGGVYETASKFKMLKNNAAVSLVECMVAMAIFLMIAGGIYTTVATSENSWSVNKVKIELQQELRKAMEWMINDLRQAGNTSITNVPADGTWYTTITFKDASSVTSGTLQWAANTVQFVRGGTGSVQLQRISGGVTKVLAQRMSSLQFRRQSTTSNILEVSMAAQSTSFKGIPVNYQLNFSVQLRN